MNFPHLNLAGNPNLAKDLINNLLSIKPAIRKTKFEKDYRKSSVDDVLMISKLYTEEIIDVEAVINKSNKNNHYLVNDVDENLKVPLAEPKGFEFE